MSQNSISLQNKPNVNENILFKSVEKSSMVKPAIADSIFSSSKVRPAIADTVFSSSSSYPNVYIVDDFHNKDIDLNNDKKGDVTHGEFVELVMKTKNPNLNIKKMPMPVDEDDWTARALNLRLQKLYSKILSGEDIDAINLSMEQSIKFNELRSAISPNLTQENLHNYNGRIRRWLAKNRPGVMQNIKTIEKITSTGTPVYIAGGSKGDEYVNFLNLAKGSIDVAGRDEDGRIGSYSSVNSLVNRAERGTYSIKHEKHGYDINGDKKPDFYPPHRISFGYGGKVGRVTGSSFAAPAALAVDMKRE